MTALKKLLLLAVLLAASLAGTASAATVTVTGGTSITATAGASRFVNHTGSQTLQCTGSGGTATLRASTTGSYPIAISTNFVPTFTGCTIGGVVGITVVCGGEAIFIAAATVSSVTAAFRAGIHCDIRLGAGTTSTCHVRIGGGIGAFLGINWSNLLHTLGIDQDHTRLALTGSPTGCTLKNGASVRFQNGSGGNLVYTVSPSISINAA
jgi:hypothetical protein